MIKATDFVDLREKMQEIFRDESRPTPAVVGNLVAIMTDGPPNIIHLGSGGRAECGMETDEDHVSVEHNEITCPLCFAIHEAACAEGDDETPYFGWNIDSILETDAFMDEMVEQIIARLSQKAAEARFIRAVLAGNAIDGKQLDD